MKGLPLHVEHSETMCCAVDANNNLILDSNKQPIRTGAPAGQLSAQDVTTGSDGRATLSYTAPSPVDNADHTTIARILVTPTGTDYAAAQPRSVDIRLVPPGFVPAGPTAAFTYSPATPVPNGAITFDASWSTSQSGTIVSYAWDFGDNSTGTGMTPQHIYRAANNYTVSLIVVDDQGRASIACKQTLVVAPAANPVAQFVFSPTAPNTNQTIFFNAAQSTPGPGRTIVDYAWNFGAATSQHGLTASTAYSLPGTYNVTLVVTDDVGQTGSASQNVAVGLTGPRADFGFSPTSPAPNQAVFFNASASTAGTGRRLVDYAWDFGNGTSQHGATSQTTTTYTAAASYNVILTVTDDIGQTASKSQAVQVAAGTATADFAVSITGNDVVLNNVNIFVDASVSRPSSGQTIASYEWIFGDNTAMETTTTRTRSHAYPNPGMTGAVPPAPKTATYTITLTVTDTNGNKATATKTVTITGF